MTPDLDRSGTGPADTRWLGGRRSTAVLALVVAVVLLMAALIVLRHRSSTPAEPPATTSSSPAPSVVTAGADSSSSPSSGPATAALNTTVPTSAPADATWQLWHTIALPVSASAGPARVAGQVASGFAHTPEGALIAALQSLARTRAATDPGWQAVITTMVAPGPGRDARMRQRAQIVFREPIAPGTFIQYAGFQFLSYTPTDAVIYIATRVSSGGFAVAPVHLVWWDGDWKLQLTAVGEDTTSRQLTATLSGFIPWSGV